MRKGIQLLFAFSLALLFWQCETPIKGTVIEGNISNATPNLEVFLDLVQIGKASDILDKQPLAADGSFSFSFPEGIDPGVYQLRIGSKRLNVILGKEDKKVTINGDFNTLQSYDFTVTGSASTQSFVQTVQGIVKRQITVDDIRTFVDTTSNPIVGAFLTYSAAAGNVQLLDLHKKALDKLRTEEPEAVMTKGYSDYITVMESQYNARMAQERIQVGQEAPNIKLPNPRGKEFALEDLKGKVVLLDFWASWCGPCRRENPKVVEVYKKYKDQGFTVFSVSLDGLDTRTKQRLAASNQSVDDMMANSKKRWVDAIQKDNLIWDYHVSDLKKWESAPASVYGVKGIPKTFLIDRDGNIAAIGLRGAEQIEKALVKVL